MKPCADQTYRINSWKDGNKTLDIKATVQGIPISDLAVDILTDISVWYNKYYNMSSIYQPQNYMINLDTEHNKSNKIKT